MRTAVLRLTLFLLAVAAMAGVARADDEVTIPIGGEPKTLAQLEAMQTELRAAREALAATAPANEETRAARLAAMEAQASALEAAIALMRQIQGLEQARTARKAELAGEREALAQAQQAAAKEPSIEGTLDEERIRQIEAAAVQAKQAVADATQTLQRLEEARKRSRTEYDTLEARRAELVAEGDALANALAALEPTDEPGRKLAELRLTTNALKQGVLGLKLAYRTSLQEVDDQRIDLAQVRVELAEVRARLRDAELSLARTRYQARLEAEAARKAEEAAARLAAAERDDSAAGKAISRLAALASRMETDLVQDRRRTLELKANEAEARALEEEAASRLGALEVLYPPGRQIETWQESSVDDQLRLLELDRAAFDRFRADVVPDLGALLAETLTKRGRLAILRHRVAATRDRLARSKDDEARLAAIERDLAHARDPDYMLWLEARRDFLKGRTDDGLSDEDVAALKKAWDERSVELRALADDRAKELEGHARSVEEIQTILARTTAVFEDRHEHLARVTFWLRRDPVFSQPFLQDVAGEIPTIGSSLVGAPAHLTRMRPTSTTAAIASILGAVLAVLLGLWLRRPREERPLPEDADEQRRALLLRAAASVGRAIALPAGLFVIALLVRALVFPGDPATLIPIALIGAWLGIVFARSVNEAFLSSDGDGACTAGCDEGTAARGRLVNQVAFVGGGLLFAAMLLLRAADAPRLASVVGFTWGLLAVVLGGILVAWPDVQRLAIMLPKGTIVARTLSGTLRLLAPLLVLFGAAVLVMYAMGYRSASLHYASRALILGLLLGGLGIAYGLLRLLLHADHPPVTEAEDEEPEPPADEDFELGRRLLAGVLAAAALASVFGAITLVFKLDREDWQQFANASLVAGLTPGKIGAALLWFAASFGIANYARDVVRVLLRSSGLAMGSRYAIRTLLFYVIVTVGILSGLSALGVRLDQFGWFLAAAGVGIGFGLQEIISNFVCGLILFFERPVQVGDIITVGTVEGDVTRISIRSTVVRTRDGVSMILPNKKLVTEDVVNWSHGEARTRLNIEVGVAYGSDVDLVRKLLMRVAADERRALRWPRPEVDFRAFGESELQFMLRLWLATPDTGVRRRIRTSLLTEINRAFRENGVEIPFPQRDLHLRSSDIGRLQDTSSDAPQAAPADADTANPTDPESGS